MYFIELTELRDDMPEKKITINMDMCQMFEPNGEGSIVIMNSRVVYTVKESYKNIRRELNLP